MTSFSIKFRMTFSKGDFKVVSKEDFEGEFNLVVQKGFKDFEDDFKGDFEGDFEGDIERDFEGDFEGDLEGDLESDLEGDFEGTLRELKRKLHGEKFKKVKKTL